jgi:hypothetical protein
MVYTVLWAVTGLLMQQREEVTRKMYSEALELMSGICSKWYYFARTWPPMTGGHVDSATKEEVSVIGVDREEETGMAGNMLSGRETDRKGKMAEFETSRIETTKSWWFERFACQSA